MNKSFITNLISILLLITGYAMSEFLSETAFELVGDYLKIAGLFALSGAFTNWLAIHMLFEKVPLLYGSGVIPNNFEVFKSTIREMTLENFFQENNFEKLTHVYPHGDDIKINFDAIDENIFFDGFVESVKASPLAGLLGMFGGTEILEKIREPFNKKMREKLEEFIHTLDISKIFDMHSSYEIMRPKIETMIDAKLDELTSQQVKMIVAQMIQKHLGWLVVWGGLFGAIIGVVTKIIALV